jgi:hypothetical protein
MKLKAIIFLFTILFVANSSIAQNIVTVTSNISLSKVNNASLHSLSLELKGLSVVSVRPGIEYEYRILDASRWDNSFYSAHELYVPITYGVRPFPKLSINTTLAFPVTNNATSDFYFRFGFDYLVGKHFQLGGNVKYNFEFDLSPRYSISASYVLNDYYKASQRYADKLRRKYNKKNGPDAFQRELEANLNKRNYYKTLGISTNVNSLIFINSLSTAATLGIQKAGWRGAFYQFKLIHSQFLVLDFTSLARYRFVGPGVFIGEHRTNEHIQFYHGADFAYLFNINTNTPITQNYPVLGYRLGLATGNFGLNRRFRIDGNFSINTLGIGFGLDLAYVLK